MVGLGYRKDFADDFMAQKVINPAFIEVAPENWMGIGGYWKKVFKEVTERYPLFTHGLSLSIGSPDPLDIDFLRKVKTFLDEHQAVIYSEHISYSKCDNAHMYDLLPMPFTEEAVKHISGRIKTVQDYLERPLTMEVVSYYTSVQPEMTELEFVNSIIDESGCNLLLDVNNIYVNGFNHGYNPYAFIDKLNLSKVSYIHMAGHEKVADDLIIDTHGNPIIDPVYHLFEYAMAKLERDVPVLLERDFNIPEFEELRLEMNRIQEIKDLIINNERYAA